MDHKATAAEMRIERFTRERILPAVKRRSTPLAIEAWDVPGEPVSFNEARGGEYRPFSAGMPWSRPWGTTWFHVTGEVPKGWGDDDASLEIHVDLGFTDRQAGFQAEGLVYRPDGSIIKALEPLNAYVPLEAHCSVDVYIEAASNPDVGGNYFYLPTHLGDPETAGNEPIYTLRRIDLVERDPTVWRLYHDVCALVGVADQLETSAPRRAAILGALERMCDEVDPQNVAGTAAAGRELLSSSLASPASASSHHVVAVGHAHIDSAWLWPVRETIRKCARTFSNVLQLMDEAPEFVFACSSAQQFDWMRRYYPQLFEQIRERVAEGRFIPVGGMWVESDINMPGGEALVRQFLRGKGFFQREFGIEPTEVWLPDTFGYTAAFPQIAKLAGNDFMLTQKLSWNEVNPMPHHTFLWEGIDGTQIFTHFPPADTYNSDLSGEDLTRAERQFSEKGESNISLLPFGFGDGGGGPTREMVEAADRKRNLEGSPTVEISSPLRFFKEAERQLSTPSVWSGEMYLELHRGTYTSQAGTKSGNRRNEHLLREAELWSATAAVRGVIEYPYDELNEIWERVLLLQFHDILPGSSIAWVHREAESDHAEMSQRLEEIIARAQRALAGRGAKRIAFNAAPVAHHDVPASGAALNIPKQFAAPIVDGEGWTMRGDRIEARFNSAGILVSLIDRRTGRDAVPSGQEAAVLQVFRDTPNQWDAWDIDVHYRNNKAELRQADDTCVDDEALVVTRSFGSSTMTQRFSLSQEATEIDIETRVDWREQEKMLKLAFAVDVLADHATSEIQFGHLQRPTHTNTSWDKARFETIAHRWVHVGEHGFGAYVANRATYGHDITRQRNLDGAPFTLVRESLLRSPMFPDPKSDQSEHVLQTSFGIGSTIDTAVSAGYRMNLPLRILEGGKAPAPVVTVDSRSVLVESVKLAEDRSGDLIVRLYESLGGSEPATVDIDASWTAAWRTDLLERDAEEARWWPSGPIEMAVKPFEIITLRMRVDS
ncbi:alpha-mannosidase [Arthrobacter castelli]|uniref:alpha-mannosidase n=1 Tax=Arthrobacter castelli TaxID=271431 RepID=UPI000404E297|nr:glycoside hydrolase family 38 C-terminal domain-containing protein [Arthrobacter castelli]